MKRFLLFAGEHYYPLGGWLDFVGSFDAKEEAFAALKSPTDEDRWWQIVDTASWKIVETDERTKEYLDWKADAR